MPSNRWNLQWKKSQKSETVAALKKNIVQKSLFSTLVTQKRKDQYYSLRDLQILVRIWSHFLSQLSNVKMRVVQKSNCPQMTFFFLKICELINPLSVDSAVFNLKKYIKKRVVKKTTFSIANFTCLYAPISLEIVSSDR